jgi:hypothetical protein
MFGEDVTDPQQVHRAVSSLRRAIAPEAGDFAHPDHDALIAFAELRLDEADREIVVSHIAVCAQCAEDVRDISDMRGQMAAPPLAPKHTWKYLVASAAAIAAVLIIAIVLRRPDQRISTKEISSVSAPSASPRDAVLSSEEQSLVASATATGRVDLPANVRALAGTVGQLLGSSASPSVMQPMSPSGTVVANGTPQFSWRAVAGAASYRVAVFDEHFREVASSGSIASTSWTPSAPLPANATLAWQVTAHLSNGSEVLAPAPPQPEARFSVLDAASAEKIAALRARLTDQPIALGILLAKSGLLDDAAREFDRAAAQPSQAALAAQLHASLRAAR